MDPDAGKDTNIPNPKGVMARSYLYVISNT